MRAAACARRQLELDGGAHDRRSREDVWQASFVPAALGRHRYTVAAWIDAFATWRHKLLRRTERDDVALALREGAALVRAAAARARGPERGALLAYAASLESDAPLEERRRSASSEALRELMAAAPDRSLETVYDPPLEVVVERPLARLRRVVRVLPALVGETRGATGRSRRRLGTSPTSPRWASTSCTCRRFIRSAAATAKDATTACRRAPRIPARRGRSAAPPAGTRASTRSSARSRTSRASAAKPSASGSRWRSTSRSSARPDHPYVREHPLWFARRPDGSVQFAENPPKKYEDIFPIDFGTPEWRELWQELRDVVLFWVDQGVKVFRVDNPHTKPFDFWRWLIADVQAQPSRHDLPRRGVQPAARDVSAGEARVQPVVHLLHVAQHEAGADRLLHGARGGARLVSAEPLAEYAGHPARVLADGRPAGFHGARRARGHARRELRHLWPCIRARSSTRHAKPGSEEYLDSEKYEIKRWDLEHEDSLQALSRQAECNPPRQPRAPARRHADVSAHRQRSARLLLEDEPDGDNVVLVVVNLDPEHAQSGFIDVPLDEWSLDAQTPYHAHELLSGRAPRVARAARLRDAVAGRVPGVRVPHRGAAQRVRARFRLLRLIPTLIHGSA